MKISILKKTPQNGRSAMKTKLQIFITLTVLLIPACKQNVNLDTERQALLNADSAWADAAISGSVEKIKTFWTEDAINFFPGQEPAFGKKEILRIVKRNRSVPGFSLTWKARDAVVSESGAMGYTYGPYKLTFSDPEGNKYTKSGNYVCIWKKQNDGPWKCVLESSVPDSQPQ